MTLAELVETIRQIAITGAPQESPLMNTTVIAELILPRVLNKLVSDAVKDDNQLNALRANHTLSITSGVVSCPSTIKEEYAESMYFLSVPTASYEPTPFDYSNGSDLFDTFRVDTGNIHYRQAGLSAGIFTGVRAVNAITLPTLPAASTDTVTLKENLLQQVITYTASIIKGEIPLAAIGLDHVP